MPNDYQEFNFGQFQKLLQERRNVSGLSRHELSLKSNGDVSAQTLALYETAGRNAGRIPRDPKRWLPLMKLFGISKTEVVEVDTRPVTKSWLETVTSDSLKPYFVDDWKCRPLSKDDLQFLVQIADGLKQPLTLGLAMDLLARR